MNQQDIVDILNERIKELEEEGENPDELDDGEDEPTHSLGGGAPSRPMGGPSLGNFDNEEPDIETPEEPSEGPEEPASPELAPQVDLADIEGQDLV